MSSAVPLRKLVPPALLALAVLVVMAFAASAAFAERCEDCDPGPGGGGGGVTYPDTTITVRPDALSTQKRPAVTYKSDLSAASYECRLAGSASEAWSGTGAWACGSTAAATDTASWTAGADQSDGTYFFQVRACKSFYDSDLGENVTRCDGTPAKATYTIDTTGPDLTWTGGPADKARVRTLPSFTFTGAEAGSKGYYCYVDNVWVNGCTSPIAFTGALAQGWHSVTVRAFDPLGNAGPWFTRQFVWDTVAPATTIDAPAITADATPDLRWTIDYDGGGQGTYACELDGVAVTCTFAWASTGGYTPVTPLADGEHTLRVRSTDSTGNAGEWASKTFTVDTAAPVIGGVAYAAAAKTVTFASDDAAAAWQC
jgi:hypothetical protein